MHAHVANRVQQHPRFRLALTGPLLLWSPSWISWLPAVSSCGLWSTSRCRPFLPPSSFTGLGRGISTPEASPMLPISVASMLRPSSHTSSRSDGSRAFRRDPLGLVRAGGGSSSGSSSAQRVTCARPSMRPPRTGAPSTSRVSRWWVCSLRDPVPDAEYGRQILVEKGADEAHRFETEAGRRRFSFRRARAPGVCVYVLIPRPTRYSTCSR